MPTTSIRTVVLWICLGLLLSAPAVAQTEFDVAGQPLNFAGAGTGSGVTVNSYRTYANVITIGGQQINARITLTGLNAATLSDFDSLVNPYGETNFFQPNVSITSVGGYATFRIDFTDTSNNPVALKNLYLNTYDLDGSNGNNLGRQFTDFEGFASYNLSTTTQITVKSAGSYTRFVTNVGGNRQDAVGSSAFNDIRARVFYATPVTSVTLRVGDEGAIGTAYYAIDPTVGYTFSNAQASLSTTKTLSTVNGAAYVAGSSIKSGDVLSYRLEVRETGLAAGGSTTLTETVPTRTTYSGSSEGWTVSGGNYTQSVVLAAGDTATRNFTVTVGTLADNEASIANTVSSSVGSCASCTVTTTTVPRLRISKAPPASLPAGGTASYSVTIANAGGSMTSGTLTFADTLPTGLTFNSQTSGSSALACTGSGQTITCTGTPQIATGGSLTVSYTVNVAASATGTLVNSVLVTAGGGDARTPANDAATPGAGGSTQGSDGLSAKSAQAVTTAIVAVTESGTAVAGTASTAIANVRSNDLVNGATATASNSTIATSGTWPSGITLDTSSGAVNVAASAAPGTYSVTYQLCDLDTPTPNCTTVADSVTVQAVDLTITMAHTGTFMQSGTGGYTLTVTNGGTSATTGAVTVTDTLPTGLTPAGEAGSGWSCGESGQVVTCTRSDALAAGSSYPVITLSVNIAANASSPLTNSATVAGGGEVDTSNDTASDTVTLGAVADLTVALSHTGIFTQGGTGSYTITATNAGSAATTGAVTVTDTLPTGLTPTTASGAGWTCGTSFQVVTCTRSDALASGSSYPPIALGVNIAASAPSSITNEATVAGGGESNTANDTASDVTTTGGLTDVTVALSHTGTFARGGTGSYTITVTNASAGATTGTVTVTDTLPTGLTPTGASGTGWTCAVSGQVVTCTRSDALAPNSSYPAIVLNVGVASNAPASVTNTASVAANGDVNASNDTASDQASIASGPDLLLAMSHAGNFKRGETGVFTLTARNAGAAATSGAVTVTDTLPTGLTAVGAEGDGWTCQVSSARMTCTRSDAVAAGAAYPPIRLTVNTALDARDSVENPAVVSGGGEAETGNDSASDTIAVVGLPDLVIRLAHVGEIEVYKTGEYDIVVTNAGEIRTASRVVVDDELPVGLTPTAATGSGWSCQIVSRKVTCSRDDVLAAGASYPAIKLSVVVGDDAADVVKNTAAVSTAAREADTANNSAEDSAVLQLPKPVELVMVKAADRASAEIGDVVTYRVTVTNPSETLAVDAKLRDTLPGGFHYVAGTARLTTGSSEAKSIEPAVEASTLVFSLGMMAPGATAEVRYRARIGVDARTGEATNSVAGVTAFRGRSHVGSRTARAVVAVSRGILSMRQFIVGRVFEDVNDNGRFDTGDHPMPDVRVYLVNGQSVTTDTAGMYSVPSLDEGALVIALDPISLPPGYTVSSGNHRQSESWTRLLRTPLGGGAMLTQDFPLVRLAPDTATPPASGQAGAAAPLLASGGRVGSTPSGAGAATPSSGARANSPSASADRAARSAEHGADLVVVPLAPVIQAGGRSSTLLRITVAESRRGSAGDVRVRTSLGQFVVLECGDGSASDQPCADSARSSNAGSRGAVGSGASVLGKVTTSGVPSGNRPGQDETEARTLAGNAPVGAASEAADGLGGDRSVEALREAIVPLINGEAVVRLLSDHVPGVAHIHVEAGPVDDTFEGEAEIVFTPEIRTPLLVSHGELAVGRAAPEFGLFGQSGDVHQRGAFFFQRNLFGDGALTVAYSSHRTINEGTGVRRMFQLDPLDRLYPIFGDSSTRYEAAQANSRVYVRVDKGHSYFLFGDLRADSARSVDPSGLTEFARNLTGARFHLESPKGRKLEITAARPETAFAREVFAGDAAGILRLSHAFVLPGSETVVVEVRDRRSPEIVVSRETLVRSVDYSLDWSTGGVLLLRSVAAMDRSLNLVQLVLTYEYEVSGLSSNVVSLRGETDVPRLGLRLGGSFLRQQEGDADAYFLQGIQARFVLPREGRLQVDVPVSHGTVPQAGANAETTGPKAGGTGAAVRLELEQPIGVLDGVIRASVSRTDRDFVNPFGVTTLPGSQNVRGSVTLLPRKGSRLLFSAGDERNKTDIVDNQRFTAAFEWTEQISRAIAIGLGYSHRDLEDRVRSLDISSHLLQATLSWQPTSRASVTVRREQNLGTADLTYPTQTVLNGRYRLTDQTRLFLTQRIGSAPIVPLGDTRNSGFASLSTRSETSVGLESTFRRATSLATRYQVENGINGTDSFALIGLMNRLPVRKDLSVDLGVERGFHLTGNGQSFNSASTGIAWTPGNRVRATTRYELRDRGGYGSILSGGLAGRLLDGVTAVSSVQLSRASYTGRQSSATQAMTGVALRPRSSDRAGLLFSYTLRRSDLPSWDRYPGQFERIGMASMDGYVRPYGPFEVFGKFAMSQRESGEEANSLVATNTYLWQGRVQARFSRYLDAAVEGRHVYQPVTNTNGSSAGAEIGAWLIPDLRLGVGYNFKGNEAIGLNFLTQPVRRGLYLVFSAKLSTMFDLFGAPPPKKSRSGAGGR